MIFGIAPAFGNIIIPNTGDVTLKSNSSTNKGLNWNARVPHDDNYGRLAIRYASTGGVAILQFDIPADAPANDTYLHIFGGNDLQDSTPGSVGINIRGYVHGFDETTATWNNTFSGWMATGGPGGTPFPYHEEETVIALNNDIPWTWHTVPLAPFINAGIVGEVTLRLQAKSGSSTNWAVFEDKEGSCYQRHVVNAGMTGTGLLPGAAQGAYIEIVPEPSAIALLMLGVVPMLRRRR